MLRIFLYKLGIEDAYTFHWEREDSLLLVFLFVKRNLSCTIYEVLVLGGEILFGSSLYQRLKKEFLEERPSNEDHSLPRTTTQAPRSGGKPLKQVHDEQESFENQYCCAEPHKNRN